MKRSQHRLTQLFFWVGLFVVLAATWMAVFGLVLSACAWRGFFPGGGCGDVGLMIGGLSTIFAAAVAGLVYWGAFELLRKIGRALLWRTV